MLLQAAQDAGVTVALGSEVVSAHPEGTLILADGTRLSADLAVAADSVGSVIPDRLGIGGTVRRYDDGIIRRLADRRDLGPGWDKTLDIWLLGKSRLRALYSPCSPSQCYLCLMSAVSDDIGARIPLETDYWTDAFPMLAGVIRNGQDNARYDRYGRIDRVSWSKGRVAIVGDAAHAMPSSLGRSASAGLLTAVRLAEAVEEHGRIEDALAEWERTNRPDIEQVQAKATHVALARSLSRSEIPDFGKIEHEIQN
nr:FAD-dependent monooxygenase [Mesobacterium pallidum]